MCDGVSKPKVKKCPKVFSTPSVKPVTESCVRGVSPVNIYSGSLSVQAASEATQARIGDAVNILVLKKAQAADAAAALGLIQSLPKPPPLATEGTVGTRLNVFA